MIEVGSRTKNGPRQEAPLSWFIRRQRDTLPHPRSACVRAPLNRAPTVARARQRMEDSSRWRDGATACHGTDHLAGRDAPRCRRGATGLTRALPTPTGPPRLTSGLPWGDARHGVVSDRHMPSALWTACAAPKRMRQVCVLLQRTRIHDVHASACGRDAPSGALWACGMALAQAEEENREVSLPSGTLPRAGEAGIAER